MKSIAAVHVEFGAANMWETLRHCFPKSSEKTLGKFGIPIRLGFICVLQSTDEVTKELMDTVTFEHPVFLEIAHLEFAHCKVQTTDYSCMKNSRRERDRLDQIVGTKSVRSCMSLIPKESCTSVLVGVQILIECRRAWQLEMNGILRRRSELILKAVRGGQC